MFGLFKRQTPVQDFEEDESPSLKAYLPREERENVYKEASITFPTGYRCRGIVLDYSEGGVRMRFQNVEHLPDFVQIDIPALKIRTQARVAWRDTIDFGLEYLEPQVS